VKRRILAALAGLALAVGLIAVTATPAAASGCHVFTQASVGNATSYGGYWVTYTDDTYIPTWSTCNDLQVKGYHATSSGDDFCDRDGHVYMRATLNPTSSRSAYIGEWKQVPCYASTYTILIVGANVPGGTAGRIGIVERYNVAGFAPVSFSLTRMD